MAFSSLIFINFFLPIVFAIYFLLPGVKSKNVWLIISSLIFYSWGSEKYVFLLLFIVIVDYIVALLIDITSRKKLLLFIGIAINVVCLFYFKYWMFFTENANKYLHAHIKVVYVALPLGLSFYVFQGLSYMIDVYRGSIGVYNESKLKGCAAQKNLIKFFTYLIFFPQLTSGPIVRYADVEQQLSNRQHSLDRFVTGFERFSIGLAKKVLIADVLGTVVDKIFRLEVGQLVPSIAWIGAICYSFQIYYDFMGYSDMAIGIAWCLGFDFPENFNKPYISKSISEFWRRWHMSLSSWFRDYIYIPLGGSKHGNTYVNLFIVFLITGIWHGANWSFVLWGIWHGIFVVAERILYNKKIEIPTVIRRIYCMFIVVIGWAIFRAESFHHAINYLKAMFGVMEVKFQPFFWRYYLDNKIIFTLSIALCGAFFGFNFLKKILEKRRYAPYIYMIGSIVLLISSMIAMINCIYSPFIYFKF